ncbi:KAT8 regulatory NSL complex subunit 1-like protein [Boleophthalmus pectinirostris]|uniref:KAT8 regulatory NSL complex subunit 1-like protein n=1 Tax=Boleophthalmus pectinirostris TaxID=150288 RepID=UPI00242B1CC8|nr:KAT8 regulatory NSL complex subunit 1-like protein [Boleophthalmus pectinirostris]
MGGFSAGDEFSQVENIQHLTWLETSPDFTEITEFAQFGHTVLKSLQEALDSEDTASSSSDDELLKTETFSEHGQSVASPYFEKRWLKERAELGSRCTWLELRVAELDGRIQQLTELHKNIYTAKGSVVLASQPMTNCQMKNTLLREMVGFSEDDNDPCSPAHLLHNIERQSAQLSLFVNSLMPPLNLSPLSKPLQPWEDERTLDSDVFVSGSSKRKMFGVTRRQLFKDHMSCVCARTRPLVTYHKPRLFRLSSVCNNNSSKCSSSLSGLTSCSCSHCSSSCDPVLLSSDMDNNSNDTLSSRACTSNSGDSSVFTKAPAREEWSQIPLVINALPLSPVHYRRHSSMPLYENKKYKQHTQHYKKRVLGLSPIRQHGSLKIKHNRVQQRKRKRQRRHSVTEDVDSCLEDSLDEIFGENYVLDSLKQSSRGAVHRRYGESVFNINNIVIPACLPKVEKLQYKDILTPSWQVVDIKTLMKNEDYEKDKDEQMETLTDEVFAQRHLPFEQKEKLRRCFWGKRRCRHSSRSGSRLSSCGAVLEENSALWSFTQLDTDEQLSTKECLPQAPWERRVFPLTEADEQTLSSEVRQWCSTCTLSSLTSLNSDLIVSQSTDTISPSYGHYMNCTNNEHYSAFENIFLSLKV